MRSCIPGALDKEYNPNQTPVNLCEGCASGGYRKCQRNSEEQYYGASGAFRCLVESKLIGGLLASPLTILFSFPLLAKHNKCVYIHGVKLRYTSENLHWCTADLNAAICTRRNEFDMVVFLISKDWVWILEGCYH